MSLVALESSLIKRAITVLEMSPSLQQICFELSYIKRILLEEFEFADTASDSILPFTLVKVTIWPSVHSNAIRFVIIIVPKVDTFIRVNVPSQTIFLITLPETFIFRAG